jgi:hypothetical protein
MNAVDREKEIGYFARHTFKRAIATGPQTGAAITFKMIPIAP